MSISIRQITPQDWKEFRTFRLQALQMDPTSFGASYDDEVAEPATFFQNRLDQNIAMGVWDAPSTLVGMAVLSLITREKERHKASINAVYISPPYRGSGLAGQLMRAVLASVPSAITQIHLTVTANNPRARALYEKFGFSVWGTEPRALMIDGVYYAEWHMAKLIG